MLSIPSCVIRQVANLLNNRYITTHVSQPSPIKCDMLPINNPKIEKKVRQGPLHSVSVRHPKCMVGSETSFGLDGFFFFRSEFHSERCIRVASIPCRIACELKNTTAQTRSQARMMRRSSVLQRPRHTHHDKIYSHNRCRRGR